MSNTVTDAIEERELQGRLDQLIPPPMSFGRKLLMGTVLLSMAVGFTVVNFGGYLVPKPFANSSFSSGSYLELDSARGLVAARVMVPNNSQRSVRVTAVTLDAPGAELIDVEVALVSEEGIVVSIEREGTVSEGSENSAIAIGSEARLALPTTIASGETVFLVLWIRPVACADGAPPWGIATATFDFGEGAFPSLSSTVPIDQDPIWEDNQESFSVYDGTNFWTGPGPLAAACEVLQ